MKIHNIYILNLHIHPYHLSTRLVLFYFFGSSNKSEASRKWAWTIWPLSIIHNALFASRTGKLRNVHTSGRWENLHFQWKAQALKWTSFFFGGMKQKHFGKPLTLDVFCSKKTRVILENLGSICDYGCFDISDIL